MFVDDGWVFCIDNGPDVMGGVIDFGELLLFFF